MKKLIIIGVIVIIVVWSWGMSDKADYKNTTYTIEGQPVTLVDGYAEVKISGSDSKTITRYFGNNAKGDLNGDTIPDLAFILTQSGGGSGTFYYIVVALQNENGSYIGTNAVLLGDRIAPQTTEIKDSQVVVNYVDRKKDEPMTAQPSVGISKYLKVLDNKLVEIK